MKRITDSYELELILLQKFLGKLIRGDSIHADNINQARAPN
jgi:hypothetical protein